MTRKTRGDETPIRITTAASSARADIAHRQKRYVITMGVRTLCFGVVALLAATGIGPGWLPWVFVAGALFLPYVAVVMANAANTRSDAFELLDEAGHRNQLRSGTDSEGPSED